MTQRCAVIGWIKCLQKDKIAVLCNVATNHNKEIKLNGLDLKGNVQTQLDKNYFICEQNLNSV